MTDNSKCVTKIAWCHYVWYCTAKTFH